MTQGSLLDGAALKELGISRAEAASKGWQEAARGAIRLCAIVKPGGFSAEDVEEIAGPAPSPGGMGAAFRRAREAGEIVPVGYRESGKPSRHRAVVRVWARKHDSGASKAPVAEATSDHVVSGVARRRFV